MFDLDRINEYVEILKKINAETIVFTDDYQFGVTKAGVYYLDIYDHNKEKFICVFESRRIEDFKRIRKKK